MSITAEMRLQVRQRAGFACEYCGVSESDTGGELTIDHYHPQSLGGADIPDNLLYCCQRCNQYKADYWPAIANAPSLWNPRQEPRADHLLTLADGTVYPLTPTGAFTIRRLRLNRPPLIAYRLQQQVHTEDRRLLAELREMVTLLERLQQRHAALLDEQRALLEAQRTLLTLLLNRDT
jgi:HNH endonuclease